jgi:uncharacterized protein (TIGR00251 family)
LFFETTNNGIILRVRLTPSSSCCKTNGIFTTPDNIDYLKINVISVPEKGKANAELITWLSKKLKIAKSDIKLISGELDRYKKILINNVNQDLLNKLKNLTNKE